MARYQTKYFFKIAAISHFFNGFFPKVNQIIKNIKFEYNRPTVTRSKDFASTSFSDSYLEMSLSKIYGKNFPGPFLVSRYLLADTSIVAAANIKQGKRHDSIESLEPSRQNWMRSNEQFIKLFGRPSWKMPFYGSRLVSEKLSARSNWFAHTPPRWCR